MLAPSKTSNFRHRRGNGGSMPITGQPGYCPEIQLGEGHPCIPSIGRPSASNSMWQHCCPDLLKHHECSPARGPQHQQPTSSPTTSGTTPQAELARLSSRPYSLRTADPSDFASVWEASIVPLLTELLQQWHCNGDFTADVHNFPEVSGESVPRVIYITLAAGNTPGDAASSRLEHTVRAELARAVPERFSPLHVEFGRGGPQRSNHSASRWWGEKDKGELDGICKPKNVAYHATPVIGMSIGPARVRDAAASLGGFVQVGSQLYAMSAFHAFEDSIETCHLQVDHPAKPDLPMIVPPGPGARPYSIGNLASWSRRGKLRPSLTFQGTNFSEESTMVEMDWCLIGPVAEGKNFVSVPSFRMDCVVAVQDTAVVEGNTEVYAMARTSGYSLGFTSDVPGLQKISGHVRREWYVTSAPTLHFTPVYKDCLPTQSLCSGSASRDSLKGSTWLTLLDRTVRQYSPFKHPEDGRASAPWQTLKQWVTSGIGVAGDSGSWLIRRSDNALMGLIWGRNHDSGNPKERVRLAYFTPMADILADVREVYMEEATLPTYSARDLVRAVGSRHPREAVGYDMFQAPWTVLSCEAIQRNRQAQADLIQSHFVDAGVPASGAVLGRYQGIGAGEEPSPLFGDPSMGHLQTLGHMESTAVGADRHTTRSRSQDEGSMTTLLSQDNLLLGMGLGANNGPSLPALSTSSRSKA
ncbi:hypothetical protein MMYC01_204979 [Madurella mycetomatis]|uniref:Uncharacterized protein n=1 Tax=Madurella mycetomatis TaxID=100816 RepID=A0A175VXR1_9PEZI|nr:hypothetical protein MMYC01_208261 [Madurella mycetomatis]KXX80052.1 hypothetical protein MMYC01_204979 [Madurella mycetomatis]